MNFKIFFAVFFLTLFLIFPFFLNPEKLTRRNGDFSDLVWPDYFFIKSSIVEHHQIPLWNPTVFSGIPEISNPQSPLIYPLNIVILFFSIDRGIVVLIFLHFLIAGLFIFQTGKLLKWNNLSCFALMVVFIFSPFFWGKVAVGHLSQLFAALLVAPLLYFAVKAFIYGGKKHYILISIFLALEYLNHPTVWFYTIFFGIITWIYFNCMRKKYKKIFFILFPIILSIFLIAPVFLLQIRTGPLITRSQLDLSDLSLPLWSIKRFLKGVFVSSNIFNDAESEVWLYPSITAIFFGFLSLKKLRNRFKFFVLSIVALVILITLGSRTPFFTLLVKYFPGFSYLRVTTRDWFLVVLILAFLCGYFIQVSKRKFTVLLILFLDLFIFSAMRLWFVPARMVYGNSFDFDRFLNSQEEGRYYCTKRCLSARDTLPQGIYTADGYHLMILKNYRQEISKAGGFSPPKYTGNIPSIDDIDAQPNAELMGKFSVKWVISDNQLTDPGFIKTQSLGNYMLYENMLFLPRVRFQSIKNNKAVLVRDTPNEIKIETKGEEDTLILADTYFPGWEVWVDGKINKIFEYDGWARAVNIGSGQHTVDFKFKPFNHILNQ